MEEIKVQLQQILIKLQVSEERQKLCEEQIASITSAPNVLETDNEERAEEDDDIIPEITNGDQIQLESYKSIPTFSGVEGTYRPWRNQVVRRMKMIHEFKKHPKYEAALAIIRTKITGEASNVLINNKTAYNIIAIIKTLDKSFADQRPLYVVEAHMTSIKQLDKTLKEFHDAINHALNLVISKIVLAYKEVAEQRSLIAEAQRKAVRAFIVGLKSQTMRHILYGRTPGTLAEAFTVAQTIYHDNDHLQLEYREKEKNQQRTQQQQNFQKKFYPKMQQQQSQNSPAGFNPKMNCNQPQQQLIQQKNKPEQMETDFSNRFKQNANKQQPNKHQRINQLQDGESNPNEEYVDDICDNIPDDLISNASNETTSSSAFLDV
jgi:hypothetical protein